MGGMMFGGDLATSGGALISSAQSSADSSDQSQINDKDHGQGGDQGGAMSHAQKV